MISQNMLPYPALNLLPLNDSFVPKHIHLPPGQRVKIGRQTNAKSVPGERNGFFDSKVLSRAHAEVWEDGGKIYIKDVKSSNGTFINSERLSPESAESEPFELHTDDIVEFGIDIVGEDNKTVVHHKVAARVVCVLTAEDAAAAARAEQHQPAASSFHHLQQQQQHPQQQGQPGGSANPNAFFRRPGQHPQQVAGIGGMGGGPARAPGKSTLTFDHILNRLQGELQKSRETGAELHALTGAMGEIHDSLGAGALNGQTVPPVPPPQREQPQPAPAPAQPAREPQPDSAALAELQAQLNATQRALADHVDKVHALESALAGQEAVRAEVAALRELLDAQRAQLPQPHAQDEQELEDDDDDDDARSVMTVTPHELESVAEEDEEPEAEQEQPAMRPRTPEPNMRYATAPEATSPPSTPAPLSPELDARLSALSSQLESALEQGRALSAQHAAAQGTIATLASRLAAIEGVRGEWTAFETSARARDEASMGKIERMVKDSLGGFKAAWDREREADRIREREERERLARELVKREVKQEHAETGLVTPPSPRSVSADSARKRRRRSSTSRGRSGRERSLESESAASSSAAHADAQDDSSSEGAGSNRGHDHESVVSVATGGLKLPSAAGLRKRPNVPLEWASDVESDASKYPTPESSVMQGTPSALVKPAQHWAASLGQHQVEASIGLLVLGVAIGAVVWRVQPE